MSARPVSVIVWVLLAVLGAALLWEELSRARLRAENESLRQGTNRLAQLSTENARLSNLVARSHGLQTLVNNQLRELLQLRSEVKGRTAKTNQSARVRAPRPAPSTNVVPLPEIVTAPVPEPAAPVALERANWSFAGYASPEAALQSVAWAMSNADVNTFLASLTPEGLEYMQRQFEGKTEAEITSFLQSELANVRALQLDRRRDVSETKTSFAVPTGEQDGAPEHVFTFKQTDSGWKLTASPEE